MNKSEIFLEHFPSGRLYCGNNWKGYEGEGLDEGVRPKIILLRPDGCFWLWLEFDANPEHLYDENSTISYCPPESEILVALNTAWKMCK